MGHTANFKTRKKSLKSKQRYPNEREN
jgi:hypothetical protein